MELEVLGYSVGSPLGAACSGYVVRGASGIVLLDCGPGVLQQAWDRGLVEQLDAIVISHMHMDHSLDLLPFSGEVTQIAVRERFPRWRPPALYVPRGRGPEVLDAFARAFGSDVRRFEETFDLREYDETDTVEVGGMQLTFCVTAHPERCYAPRVTDGRASLVYSADGAYTEALVEHATGVDLVLVEATYVDPGPELEQQGHMTGEQAADLAQRAGARQLVLTHVGPWPERNAENVRRARERFAGEIEIASTGAVFTID